MDNKTLKTRIMTAFAGEGHSLNHSRKAFTLAETLIVLVILGVVAAITIPALVNRHMEAERRTKLRKAMSVYDAALNKMVIENGIKSDTALTNWADSDTKNDCANTSAYFKVARNLEVNGNATNCKFRAPDGVFWDISDIKKPLIALREQDLNAETAQSDTNRAFYMFGWFDENGSLRANDLGKISATDKADLQKLYDFINGKTKTTMGEVANNNSSNEDQDNNICDIVCKFKNRETIANCADLYGDDYNSYKNCAHTQEYYEEIDLYDENGNVPVYYETYNGDINGKIKSEHFYNIEDLGGYSGIFYDEDNNIIGKEYYHSDGTFEEYSIGRNGEFYISGKNEYLDENTILEASYTEDENGIYKTGETLVTLENEEPIAFERRSWNENRQIEFEHKIEIKDGNEIYNELYYYDWDEFNNPVYGQKNGNDVEWRYNYYDESGKIESKTEIINGARVTTFYDINGNVTSIEEE